MEFFLNNFKSVSSISGIDTAAIDELYDKFCDYKIISDNEIESVAWTEAKVVDGLVDGEEVYHYRVDVLWWYINAMAVPGSSKKCFGNLVKVAELVLVGEERLFSMVRKNKTDSRSLLHGTLSSLLAMKLQYPESVIPCHKWVPSEDLLQNSKKATMIYNDEH